MNEVVKVGVGCIIFRQEKILLGLRDSLHGKGYWAPPGGHIEFGETPEECAQRETHEETGLIITKAYRGPWTNDIFDTKKHYITLFMIAQHEKGEVILKEPDKCKEWQWVDYNDLPNPLFLPIQNLLKIGFDWDYLYNLITPLTYTD